MIQCWDEAVAAMTLGERAMVTCSADTAYGDRGAGGPSAAPPPPHRPPPHPPVDLTQGALPRVPHLTLPSWCPRERDPVGPYP